MQSLTIVCLLAPLLAADVGQVRSIFASKCYQCHGPDANTRQADLRFDRRDSLTADRGGYVVVSPGDLENSELLARIVSTDPDVKMPPPTETQQLQPTEIDLIKRWIEKGAPVSSHWAFAPPQRPMPPKVQDTAWPINPVDRFTLATLESHGLRPSPPADRPTLLRRVSLDLIGLPPTPEEVHAFVNDRSPDAYEKAVDRLLDSPRYGERMALQWLDAARYADSGGYQGDILRSMWLWRDWVIDAYNANMPFDQFTIEQLAGDLLSQPTRSQRIATGFNRNHRINDEDGIVHEEFRVEYVADRVDTLGTVWLGLTIQCARCHDHKYDPISQKEYYSLFAYFNSVNESGRGHGNAPPLLHATSPEQDARLAEIDQAIERKRKECVESVDPKASPSPEGTDDVIAEEIAALEKQRTQLLASVPTVMVMEELPTPRPTHVLGMGAYDQLREKTEPATPAALSTATTAQPGDRLGLARWLVDPGNPLTARVAVNRYWQMYFGNGLVETPEDFGIQGAEPTHPELLDWLATEFIASGWNVKRMQRLIVSSATYRQSSRGSEELLARDPDNRLLARGARFRLAAETIRDQALAASGLLVETLGGPSVRPYQPPGLWEELASNAKDYQEANDAGLYRRSLYTFVRRTIPPPAMTTFDAPNRELCVVRRPRTNTPLQALNLMNDRIYVEAARSLAERVLRHAPDDAEMQIATAFGLLLGRRPGDQELTVLTDALTRYERRYREDPESAAKLLSVGESPVSDRFDPAVLASRAALCSILLNLDETVVKE